MVYPSKQRYDKRTLLRVSVVFNRNTEPELTKYIEGKENRPTFIRKLVRKEMLKEQQSN